MKTAYKKHQKQLLQQARQKHPLSKAVQKAYLATPRHLFVKRFRQWGSNTWRQINDNNLEEHLPLLYADKPLPLFVTDDDHIPSTISQPSFVLRMLDMLQFEPGQTVFELGAGSGWNAALMGRLVAPNGHVYSLEIIPEVAQTAVKTINQLGINNVQIIEADGGAGYAANAPYDRAIFTAGAYDLPHHFFEQIKDSGLLLFVLKNEGGGDTLFLLEKRGVYFQSLEAMACSFVQMTGDYQPAGLHPLDADALVKKFGINDEPIAQRPFQWGDKTQRPFRLRLSSFLSIIDPSFRVFKTAKEDKKRRREHHFGLWDEENRSLAIVKRNRIVSYGNPVAEKRLARQIKRWVKQGMPNAADFDLKIYPMDYPLTASDNQRIVKRSASQFLWSLNGS